MCILITKPAGVKMPPKATMKMCWDNNPDGAGIAWSDGRKLFLRKGMMKWKDFEECYDELSIDACSAIIHFRIATHGTVKPENTHPFNVNDSVIAAHNGILSIKNEGDWTDSETFFKRVCAPILRSYSIVSKEFELAVNAIIGTSKLAFLTEQGQITMYGNFTHDDGIYYSNTTYLQPKVSYNNYNYGYSGGYGRLQSTISSRVGKSYLDTVYEFAKKHAEILNDEYIIHEIPFSIQKKGGVHRDYNRYLIADTIVKRIPTKDAIEMYCECAGWGEKSALIRIFEDGDVYEGCIADLQYFIGKCANRTVVPETFDAWVDLQAGGGNDTARDVIAEVFDELSNEAFDKMIDIGGDFDLHAITPNVESAIKWVDKVLRDLDVKSGSDIRKEILRIKYKLNKIKRGKNGKS